MERIGKDFIQRAYDSEMFKKIEYVSDIQDRQYGGRLSKGDTYLIGKNDNEMFYLTNYNDSSMELWRRRRVRSGFQEDTIVILNNYESNCIYRMIECLYDIMFIDSDTDDDSAHTDKDSGAEDTRKKDDSNNTISSSSGNASKWDDDKKVEFLRKRLIEEKTLSMISREMGIRIGQVKGLQKYYKDGKFDDLVHMAIKD